MIAPSWTEIRVTGNWFENGPLKDHSLTIVNIPQVYIVPEKILPAPFYVKFMFADVGHVGWRSRLLDRI